MSYFPMTRDDETLLIRGDRTDVRLTPDTGTELTIERLENDVPDRTVRRARFTVPVEDRNGECEFSVAVERT